MKISIVTNQPGTAESVGGFEWRIDPAEAEKMFRDFRTAGSTTTLWHGVEIQDDMTPEEITDYVDYCYWQAETAQWGEPARVYVGPNVRSYEEWTKEEA